MFGVVKRLRPGGISYGRGSDSYRRSATYGVFCGDVQKATIRNDGTGQYMAPTDWVVEHTERAASGKMRRHYASSFKKAKTWAIANVC